MQPVLLDQAKFDQAKLKLCQTSLIKLNLFTKEATFWLISLQLCISFAASKLLDQSFLIKLDQAKLMQERNWSILLDQAKLMENWLVEEQLKGVLWSINIRGCPKYFWLNSANSDNTCWHVGGLPSSDVRMRAPRIRIRIRIQQSWIRIHVNPNPPYFSRIWISSGVIATRNLESGFESKSESTPFSWIRIRILTFWVWIRIRIHPNELWNWIRIRIRTSLLPSS